MPHPNEGAAIGRLVVSVVKLVQEVKETKAGIPEAARQEIAQLLNQAAEKLVNAQYLIDKKINDNAE